MGSPKIITLETGADAAQVAGHLKAMGQWVQPAQGDGVQPVLLIEPHSANCTRERVRIFEASDQYLPFVRLQTLLQQEDQDGDAQGHNIFSRYP